MQDYIMTVTLPEPLIRGRTSTRMFSDMLRGREPEFEKMFEPGQEVLANFYLPPFQRPPSWSDNQSAKLIESTWLGLPIGAIVVTSSQRLEMNNDKYPHTADWLIDGQQRLRALSAYFNNDLVAFPGTAHAHKFHDLDIRDQRRWKNKTMGYIELDEADETSLRELYNRLNFSGTAHTEDQRA